MKISIVRLDKIHQISNFSTKYTDLLPEENTFLALNFVCDSKMEYVAKVMEEILVGYTFPILYKYEKDDYLFEEFQYERSKLRNNYFAG